jgi:hypothetical protein
MHAIFISCNVALGDGPYALPSQTQSRFPNRQFRAAHYSFARDLWIRGSRSILMNSLPAFGMMPKDSSRGWAGLVAEDLVHRLIDYGRICV